MLGQCWTSIADRGPTLVLPVRGSTLANKYIYDDFKLNKPAGLHDLYKNILKF